MSRAGKFLIASPTLQGFFHQSVIFVYEDNNNGSGGLIINRPSGRFLADLLQQHSIPYPPNMDPIFIGGPMQPMSVMMMHTDEFFSSNTLRTPSGISISSDDFMIDKIVQGNRPNGFKIFGGAAGWGPGQLDKEMSMNSWLLTDLPQRVIWDRKAGEVWQASVDHVSSSMFNQYF
jgi:putative transcriptional regulator